MILISMRDLYQGIREKSRNQNDVGKFANSLTCTAAVTSVVTCPVSCGWAVESMVHGVALTAINIHATEKLSDGVNARNLPQMEI
ncbi:hypothetical protein AAES_121733 [Amazona aestiva]|uniref:Uncharacterized protein n=1 Tax=Amazona aestiva TaxID=12930 RepID=A0A0Q3QXY9_AMAAE|nr:hypothetical protein AAES_121733 [Amazona aestiva]